MTPLEKCVSILAALAAADARGSLGVAVAEIDAYQRAAPEDHDGVARALYDLRHRLSVAAPATAAANEIDAEIRRRIAALSEGGQAARDGA